MRRAGVITIAAFAFAFAAPSSASAAEQQAYAAAMNYLTPVIVAGQGDKVTFNNLDPAAQHDIVSDEGKFKSKTIPAGQKAPVEGVEQLEPGTFKFHCSLHSWMRGALQISSGSAPSTGGGGLSPGVDGEAPIIGRMNATPDPMDLAPQAEPGPMGRGSWPLYGHDLANSRNGRGGPSKAEVPMLGPAWSFYSPEGDFTGTPVVARKTLVAGSSGGVVYALNAETGKLRWKRKLGDEMVNGTVAITGKRVYVPYSKPNKPEVVALDLKDGDVLWRTPVDDQKNSDVYGSPVVWRKKVYIGVSALFGETGDKDVKVRGNVVALDARTGKMRWKTFMVPPDRTGAAVWTTPAIDKRTGRLYVGTGNAYQQPAHETTDSIVMLDARSGRMLDHFQATPNDTWNATGNVASGPDHDFGASPQLITGDGGRKLVGEGQKSGVYWAVDRKTLDPVWQARTGAGSEVGGIIGSTAFDGKAIYGPDTPAGEQWSLDPKAGQMRWVSADGGPAHFNSTSTSNGVVYTTDMSGSLTARDAESGLVLARLPLGSPAWGGVAIAGGSVFAATGTQGGSGYLVSYRVRKGAGAGGTADDGGAENANPNPERGGKERRDNGSRSQPSSRVKNKKRARRQRARHHRRHGHHKKHRKQRKKQHAHQGDPREPHDHKPGSDPTSQGGGLEKGIIRRGDHFVPRPVGTTERLTYYFGPYTVPPGQDLNRVDIELPMRNGMLLMIDPSMRRVGDLSEPMHQEAHIHHAHWFSGEPGSNNPGDVYFGGNAEWIFGNGDEETRADFRARSAADPKGPVYGQYVPAHKPQPVIYMLHNKTAQPLEVYIVLDVVFKHGSPEELTQKTGRPHHDVQGMLFGRTFDVPRDPSGDGVFEYATEGNGRSTYGSARDSLEPPSKYVELTVPEDGVIIGMGGHLHPGGKRLVVENYGSEASPCRDDGRGYGGTLLFNSDARFRNAPLSEDFQMEVTHPGFRAPVHKGDRIRISGTYENKLHAWYAVMTHLGIYMDRLQKPWSGCKPKVINSKKWNPVDGVLNRPFSKMTDTFCGERWGGPPCEKPEDPNKLVETPTDHVTITNFVYTPGDRKSSGDAAKVPTIQQGQQLTFYNSDQALGIRHTVTTCPWPCNGPYVANYPLADGAWDSGTMGYDPIDKGQASPIAKTPPELASGTYAYFCRIHPWMRGAFRVKPALG